MKNKLEEILIGKVASVLCVKSRRYTSVNGSYQIFSALPILPYEPHSDAKIIGFPIHIFTMTIVSGLTNWLNMCSVIGCTKLVMIGQPGIGREKISPWVEN
jgi:hypothetical protein